jgi:hypothetical protein
MATINLTIPNAVATMNIAAIKFVFPEETASMTNAEVAKFGIKQGLKPFMRAYQASQVNKSTFETSAEAVLTAQAASSAESVSVKNAQRVARDQADQDIDSIT